jgi:hypothetical protein
MPIPARKEAMSTFAGANPEGGQPIMVCTDLAARGLDFPGQVEHVVNFDFPYNPVDYLHRCAPPCPARPAPPHAAARPRRCCCGASAPAPAPAPARPAPAAARPLTRPLARPRAGRAAPRAPGGAAR